MGVLCVFRVEQTQMPRVCPATAGRDRAPVAFAGRESDRERIAGEVTSRPEHAMHPSDLVARFREMKSRGERITALTAYDYPTARLLDESGLDVILVNGDGSHLL